MDFHYLDTQVRRRLYPFFRKDQIRYYMHGPLQPGREYHAFDAPWFRQVFHPDEADWVVVMVNTNFPRLADKDIWFLNLTKKPVLVLERADAAVVWFRQFRELDNLRLVVKNSNYRDLAWNNRPVFYGRMHLEKIRRAFDLPETHTEPMPDASDGMGYGPLSPELREADLAKIRTLPWDVYCSPLSCVDEVPPSPVPFADRTVDVFCVSSDKRGILGRFRRRLRDRVAEIGDRNGLKVQTERLPQAAFMETLRSSRLSVSAPGWGEHVRADWHAVLSNVTLLKPECGYVLMDPDVYHPDIIEFFEYTLADLETRILALLARGEAGQEKAEKARQRIVQTSKAMIQERLHCEMIRASR